MKIRLENKTKYRNDHLRAIIRRAVRGYYDKPDLMVEVVYTKGGHGGSSGCAHYNSRWFTVRLSNPSPRRLNAAQKRIIKAMRGWHEQGRVCTTGSSWSDRADRKEAEYKAAVLPDKIDFAMVCAHEALHCMGVTHRRMNTVYREVQRKGRYREKFGWAADMPLDLKAPPKKKVRPTGIELACDRHEHANAMLAKADTRLKRAQTIRKKWHRKVRYYEGRMAALKGG